MAQRLVGLVTEVQVVPADFQVRNPRVACQDLAEKRRFAGMPVVVQRLVGLAVTARIVTVALNLVLAPLIPTLIMPASGPSIESFGPLKGG